MSSDLITVKVTAVEQVAPAIREFTLTPLTAELSAFSPGAHVVVEMPGANKTYKNAYSLMSDPGQPQAYKIAVRLQEQSRGGSRYMHEQVAVGDELVITPPANLFAPHWQASKHILIAGGVGITPFLSYLPEFKRRNTEFELHYLFRSHCTGAYRQQLATELADKFFSYDSDNHQRCDLSALFSQRLVGTHFYICGPQLLITAVCELAQQYGVPASAVHYEEFAAPQPGLPFEVELAGSGQQVPVGPEESMLEALEAAGVAVPNLCRGGVCGQCVCDVLAGEVDHRDNFLSSAEKAAGQTVMPCVSRAKGEKLVIDVPGCH